MASRSDKICQASVFFFGSRLGTLHCFILQKLMTTRSRHNFEGYRLISAGIGGCESWELASRAGNAYKKGAGMMFPHHPGRHGA